MTGLSFWKPMLINVIEFAFPTGEGYPRVGAWGNSCLQGRIDDSSKGKQGCKWGKRKEDGSRREKDKINRLVGTLQGTVCGWCVMTKPDSWQLIKCVGS